MAITKQRKEEMLATYRGWLDRSQAIILVEYTGLGMKDLDAIRAKVRESGGEFHVLKNTLARRAFEAAGLPVADALFEKSTAVGFAFSDVGATARAMDEFARSLGAVKIKGGYLGRELLDAERVKSLANLPSLPVARAMLLGVLQAPAGKLVRLLAEPGRQLAYVIKAHADQSAPAAA